ncbi:hypothetical protein Smp_172770 [Schistosoma mansoni]|uniref:hypothetical protein n=1 Tax=Schistosoma mansoni TaxID=6183 RepID=UPI00022DC682|nr:hypothetical protein Smp_172770 [Schistosoma mansoni]|eukprot:XP_018648003.1 hypothetical protein Smp_172770 [Schistosoma mansoni]
MISRGLSDVQTIGFGLSSSVVSPLELLLSNIGVISSLIKLLLIEECQPLQRFLPITFKVTNLNTNHMVCKQAHPKLNHHITKLTNKCDENLRIEVS